MGGDCQAGPSARAPRRARVTIRDVARIAGVSLGTASNVLNNPGVVAGPTRRRVQEAIANTGFVRSTAAHQLRVGRSLTVGVVLLDLSNPFFGEMVRGAEGVLRDKGYVLMVCSSDESVDQERRYLRALEEHRVDGLLITPVERDLKGLVALSSRGVPTVLLDRDPGGLGLCSVTVDDVRGGELAAGHLLELGHRRVGFVNGPLSIRQCADRRTGAKRAFRRAGLKPEDGLVEVTVPALTVDHGEEAVAQLLAKSPRLTAVMCANDLLALGVLRGLASAGVAVPGDMVLVGYDDVAFASMLSPPLSSVRQPKYELGASAASLLLEEASQGAHEHRSVRFEPELVVRASTGSAVRTAAPSLRRKAGSAGGPQDGPAKAYWAHADERAQRCTPRLTTAGQEPEATGSEVRTAAGAGHVLGANARSEDQVVKAAPELYPHQWSWDTAFIAIGLAQIDASLAQRNLDALFSGQWANGMVPHIVFDPHASDYFPGPERWGCAALAAPAPDQPQTSGICQPPLHAVAAKAVVEAARRQGTAQASSARDWLEGFYPKLVAWHRFLVRERVDPQSGLVTIFHGWESGMDNSPRWDAPYSAVEVGATLPPYQRRDTKHVADPSMRPTDREYDRYLWLVEEAKQAGYDQAVLARSSSFRVGDVFFTAIFAAANEDLADLSELLGAGGADELRDWARRARGAVEQVADPKTGLTADLDLRTGQKLETETVAGFSPLIAGALPEMRDSLIAELFGPRWAGHPGLRWPLPPSTSPGSVDFRPRSYWRGPVWPCMSWLLSWALRRSGEPDGAEALRLASLKQLESTDFAEYYEPFSGTPLGSLRQSWTAAVALEWLCGPT